MSLRAYKVSHDEERSEIEFFSDEDAEQGIGQEDYAEVERAPAFDKYAPGPVVMSQYLAEGWWWVCQECEHHVSAEGCDDCYDEADDDTPRVEPVIRKTSIFCSQKCADVYDARRRAAKVIP